MAQIEHARTVPVEIVTVQNRYSLADQAALKMPCDIARERRSDSFPGFPLAAGKAFRRGQCVAGELAKENKDF